MDELKTLGKILVTDSEINILKKYSIAVEKCSSFDEILFLIDKMINEEFDLTDEEYEEIDSIASVLQERKYYMESKK